MLNHYKLLFFSLSRLLKEMGPFYGTLVSILIFFSWAFLYTTNNYLYSGGISLGIILLIHFKRKDVPYLKHFFKGKVYWMLLGEYFLVSLLFFIASIMNGWWPEMMVFLPILLIVAAMKSGISSERWQNIPVLFGNSSLGLKSGFRLYYPFWLLCLALIFIVSALDKSDVFLVMVYFYLFLISGFQTSGDPPGYIRISNSPGRYSTGMKKKLGLISVFLAKDDVFLLDEPFNGLDFEGVMVCRKLIKSFDHSSKVVLLSSHMMEHLKEVSSVVHFLDEGTIKKSYNYEEFPKLGADLKERYNTLDF